MHKIVEGLCRVRNIRVQADLRMIPTFNGYLKKEEMKRKPKRST